MSSYDFHLVFDWLQDDEEYDVVRIYKDHRLNNFKGESISDSSWLREEISQVGLCELLNLRKEPLPDGRYECKMSIHVSKDYYGECDAETIVHSITPTNRSTKRALKHHEQKEVAHV